VSASSKGRLFHKGDPAAKGDSKAGRVVSPQAGLRSTVAEEGKHGRSGAHEQGQPEVETDR